MEQVEDIMMNLTLAIEMIGVGILVLGTIICLGIYAYKQISNKENCYTELRNRLAKVILLGLEILIVADIIYTVTTGLKWEETINLLVIVLIRIILSLSIHVELHNRVPWRKGKMGE